TAAFILQVTPSIWTAYRTARPTGVSPGTWLLILGELTCWLAFGLHKTDPRLITLGASGVTASALMLTRIRWASRTGQPAKPRDLADHRSSPARCYSPSQAPEWLTLGNRRAVPPIGGAGAARHGARIWVIGAAATGGGRPGLSASAVPS